MYKTIKGIYKKGQIIPKEPIDIEQDEVELFITFLKEEKTEPESVQLSNSTLYTIGDRAVEGKFKDGSANHDQYIY